MSHLPLTLQPSLSNFYGTLNNLAQSFKQYDQNTIEIIGHTDSTGPTSTT